MRPQFMRLAEVNSDSCERAGAAAPAGGVAISVEGASFYWSADPAQVYPRAHALNGCRLCSCRRYPSHPLPFVV